GGAQAINVQLTMAESGRVESRHMVSVGAAIAAVTEAADAAFGGLNSATFLSTDATGTLRTTNFAPNPDNLVEGNEAATLTPSGSTLSGQVSYTASDVTILDADTANIKVVAGQTVAEVGGAQAINVQLTMA